MTDIINWAKETLRFGSIALVVCVVAIGALLLYVRPRWGRRWIVATALVYWFVSTPFGSTVLVTPLVRGFHSIEHRGEAESAGAVVVLGGGIRDLKVGSDALAFPYEGTTLRVMEAARVYRLLGGDTIVVPSGGRSQVGRRVSEAEVMADALSALGVPRDRIVIEDRSLTTQEQAVLVTSLLRSRGIRRFVIVTSPAHMSRSVRVFRAQRADVIPSISGLLSDFSAKRRFFVPNEDSLQISDAAVYGYAGLAYYWARGWFRPVPEQP